MKVLSPTCDGLEVADGAAVALLEDLALGVHLVLGGHVAHKVGLLRGREIA